MPPKEIEIKFNIDDRGTLGILEDLPIGFEIERFYFASGDPGVIRGNHGHINLEQIIFCIKGSFRIKLFHLNNEYLFELREGGPGIFIPKLTWRTLYDFSPDTYFGVLASQKYDESDYIFDYDNFKSIYGHEGKS